ncbi:MAG: histidinol-phosphate transaminase [Syntrophales bacterium]
MNNGKLKPNTVYIPRTKEHTKKAISFAEKSASGCGLGKQEVLSLVLAVEEIFFYLCHNAGPGQNVEILSTDGTYYLQMDFVFSEAEVNLRAFNLTHQPVFEKEEDMLDVGLLIASRQVDQFQLIREPNHMLRLVLIKGKRYPLPDETQEMVPADADETAVILADPGSAEQFARMTLSFFEMNQVPPFFENPGKVSGMIASGEYACAVAADEHGHQAGGILWRYSKAKTTECYGPYIFGQPGENDLDAELLECCLRDVAKTPAINLINRYRGGRLPRGYFDELGSYSEYKNDDSTSVQIVFVRQLSEDPGAKVWASPQLDDFLLQEYRRLVLPREVTFVRDEDHSVTSEHSVLAADLQREQNAATLRLLWPGKDIEQNVANHVKLFEEENWRNVSAEVDLGLPWQAQLTASLLKSGFMPRLILPHAGQGDVVLFRRPPALNALVPEFVKSFEPYIPSRPPDILKKQYQYETLYHLNNNENALGPPSAAQQVLRDFPSFNATYYPSGDSYHLRLRLAEFYGLHPDQFIVGNGANESITLLIKAFCEIGDNIVTADKTYGGYEWVARFSGIGALLTPLKDLTFDPEAMLEKINARTKIVFLCNPNNPTGTYWSRRQLTDFMDRVLGRCIVVMDEAYCEFVDQADYPDGMSLIGTYPNLVIFRTFSKMYGLAGLRIGYLAADIDVINIIHRTAVVYSVNALAQAAALAAIGDRDHILRTWEMVAEGKDFLKKELSLLGLEFSAGEGNYLSINLPFSDSLAYRRMMQQGVMVRMMTAFRFPNCIRVTIARMEAMQACIEALKYTLKDIGDLNDGKK